MVFEGVVEELEELEEGVDTNLLPVELIKCYGKQGKKQVQPLAQMASNAMLSQLKSKWRVKRPAYCVEKEPQTVCIDLAVDLAALKAKWRPRGVGGQVRATEAMGRVVGAEGAEIVEEVVKEVVEVVNKRGRRCEHEYECRWVGDAADENTWEAAASLTSTAAREAVKAFEDRVQSARNVSLIAGGFTNPICTECCNSVVELEDYEYKKNQCYGNAACTRRILSACGKRSRARK